MLCGHRPFRAPNGLELLQQVIHASPAAMNADVPEAMRALVMKALEKNPGDRFPSMREMVSALRAAQRGDQRSGHSIAAPRRQNRLWIAAAGLAIIVIAAAAAWWFSSRETSTQALEYIQLTKFSPIPR